MFKFVKEIKDSIKEGIEEGREELRVEAAKGSAETVASTLGEQLQTISADEQFAVALGAPYREVYSRCIGSWAGKSAVTLYQIELPPEDLKHYAGILKRDFDIVGEATALASIGLFKKEIEQGTGYAKTYSYLAKRDLLKSSVKFVMSQVDNEYTKKAIDAVLSNHASLDLGPKGGDAFRIAVIAHIASAAGALGYLHKYQVMQHLHVVAHMARKRYTSWQHYSDGFIAGQRTWGMQGAGADKVLAGAIKKLHNKEQSPWQMIAWNQAKQENQDDDESQDNLDSLLSRANQLSQLNNENQQSKANPENPENPEN